MMLLMVICHHDKPANIFETIARDDLYAQGSDSDCLCDLSFFTFRFYNGGVHLIRPFES